MLSDFVSVWIIVVVKFLLIDDGNFLKELYGCGFFIVELLDVLKVEL